VSVEGKGPISKFLKVFLTSIELNSEFDLDIKKWMATLTKPCVVLFSSFEDSQSDRVSTYFFRSFLFNGRSEDFPVVLHCWS
jgi:hypothetical protein